MQGMENSGTAPADSRVLLAMSGSLAAALRAHLHAEGFALETVDMATQIVPSARRMLPDLLVLDARFRAFDILAVLDNLRFALEALPILVLLPTRETGQILRVLDQGADDCLALPFSLAELVMRMRVLLRRHRRQQQQQRQFPHFEIRPDEHQVLVDGQSVQLTALEFHLLDVLSSRPGVVMPRDRLVNLVWGDEWAGDYRVVDSHISRLRRKLTRTAHADCPVRSVHGVGYVFRPDAAAPRNSTELP